MKTKTMATEKKHLAKGHQNSIRASRNGIRVVVDIYIFKEHDYYISYCPSIDICTSGYSHDEALSNFYERLEIYIDSCMEKGTLWDDLKAHGWTVTKTRITPPPFQQIARIQEVSKLLSGHTSYSKVSSRRCLPAMS